MSPSLEGLVSGHFFGTYIHGYEAVSPEENLFVRASPGHNPLPANWLPL
jgi:hypothetical protein